MPASTLPARPSLDQLRKQAKELLKSVRAGDAAASSRFGTFLPTLPERDAVTLADAQLVVAREYGFDNWPDLVHHVEMVNPPGLRKFERMADELVAGYMSGDYEGIREVNWVYGTSFVWYRELEAMHQRLPTWFASESRSMDLAVTDARYLVARRTGFESWDELVRSLTSKSPAPALATAPRRIPFCRIDAELGIVTHVADRGAKPRWTEVPHHRSRTGGAPSPSRAAALHDGMGAADF